MVAHPPRTPRPAVAPARVAFTVVPSVAVMAAALTAAAMGSWSWLGVEPLAESFGDLRQVTATADCVRADPDWSLDSPTCDPFDRGYNYPTMWARAFAWLGLGEAATAPLAVAMIVMFAASVGWVLWTAWAPAMGRFEVALVVVTVAGPGTWLALERANTDLFVFALATCAAVALTRGHAHRAVVALAVATAWKFFPIGALAATVTTRARLAMAALGFLAAGGLLLAVELPTIRARTPMFDRLSYGISVLPAHLTGQPPGSLTARLMGAALLVAITVAVLVVESRLTDPAPTRAPAPSPAAETSAAQAGAPTDAGQTATAAVSAAGPPRSLRVLAQTIAADSVTAPLFTIGAGVFLASFVLGASWDYRMIFLLVVVVALVRHPDLWWARSIALTVAAATVLTAMDGSFEVIGDLLLTVAVAPLAMIWLQVVIAGFDVVGRPGWLRLAAPTRGG